MKLTIVVAVDKSGFLLDVLCKQPQLVQEEHRCYHPFDPSFRARAGCSICGNGHLATPAPIHWLDRESRGQSRAALNQNPTGLWLAHRYVELLLCTQRSHRNPHDSVGPYAALLYDQAAEDMLRQLGELHAHLVFPHRQHRAAGSVMEYAELGAVSHAPVPQAGAWLIRRSN